MLAREVGGESSSSSQQEGCGSPPGPGGDGIVAEMFGQFQDWCLRTYGDSGKTKTVTRRKYNKILQTLLPVDQQNSTGVFLRDQSATISARFKFWVRSKGFQVGAAQESRHGSADPPVLYVPAKNTVSGSAAPRVLLLYVRVELSLDGCSYFSEPCLIQKSQAAGQTFTSLLLALISELLGEFLPKLDAGFISQLLPEGFFVLTSGQEIKMSLQLKRKETMDPNVKVNSPRRDKL